MRYDISGLCLLLLVGLDLGFCWIDKGNRHEDFSFVFALHLMCLMTGTIRHVFFLPQGAVVDDEDDDGVVMGSRSGVFTFFFSPPLLRESEYMELLRGGATCIYNFGFFLL